MEPQALALILAALSLAVAVAGLHQLLLARTRSDEIAARAQRVTAGGEDAGPRARWNSLVAESQAGRALRRRLVAAGIETPAGELVAMTTLAAAGAVLVVTLVLPFWFALLVGAGVVRGAFWSLERKREQRREAFTAQLPQLARLLSNGTSAGLSMTAALEVAAGELDDPARSELHRTLGELRIGRSLERALGELEARMPSRELGVLVGALVIQQRSGGDVVRALQDMAETLEDRKDLRREVRTLMTGAIFTAYIVAALGVGSLVLLNLANPGVLENITTSAIGVAALAIAGVLYAVGFVLVRQVTRVDI